MVFGYVPQPIREFSSYIYDVVHAPEKSQFSATLDTGINVFDAESLKLLNSYQPHENTISDLVYSSFHPNSLFTCSIDQNAFVWDTRQSTPDSAIKFTGK